jgi:hypothetical protein
MLPDLWSVVITILTNPGIIKEIPLTLYKIGFNRQVLIPSNDIWHFALQRIFV